MILYLDTSAFVPILINEQATELCASLWSGPDDVASCMLLYAETAAALASARRRNRIDDREYRLAKRHLDELWLDVAVIPVDEQLVRNAARLSERFGLRGYDAVHCAAAASLGQNEIVAVSGDRELLDAWSRLGLATIDANGAQRP